MIEGIKHPHDRFVKEILSNRENARDFFLQYLPAEVRSHVDLKTLEICKDTFIEKELGGNGRQESALRI